MKRVCCFGAYDPAYPRHRILRDGLVRAGHEVVEARVPERRLIFDPLVSRVGTLVGDWGLHARGSGLAWWNGWVDRLVLGLSDIVLCDTWAHGRLYAGFGVPWSRLRRVAVGAQASLFAVPPRLEARAVLTGDSEGIREWVEPGTHLDVAESLPRVIEEPA